MCQLTPPAEEVASDEAVEDDTNNDPRKKVVKGSGRHKTASTEDCGPDDVSGKGARVALGNKVLNGWASSTNEPEPVGPGINATSTEDTLRTL